MAFCYMEEPKLLEKPIVHERSPIYSEECIFREDLRKIRFDEASNKYATYYNTQFKLNEVQPSEESVKDTIKKTKVRDPFWVEKARQHAKDIAKAYEEATTLEQESKSQKTKVTQQTTVRMSSSEENSKVSVRRFKYPTLPRDDEFHVGPRPSTSYTECVMNHDGSNETRKKGTKKKVDEEETNANAGNNPRTETLTVQPFLGKTKRRAPQPPRQNASTSKVHQETETGVESPEEPVNYPQPNDEEDVNDPPSSDEEGVNDPPPNDEEPVKDPPSSDEDSPARERTIVNSGKSRLYINPKNEERLQGQAALCKVLEAKYKEDEERKNSEKTKKRSRWMKMLLCCGACCWECTECI